MKNHDNQPGTLKNPGKPWKTIKKTMKNHEKPWKIMKNHEKPTWNHEKPWKTNLEPWKANLEPWKTMKTDLEVEVEVDLRQLGKVLIFRDTHTEPSYYI